MTITINLRVGRGERRGALTVYPIWQQIRPNLSGRLASKTSLRVTENLAQPEIPTLQVTPTGSQPVLLLDGDLLIGGKQDRIAIGSTLLPSGTTTAIAVRCVEPDRWSGSMQHATGSRRATSFVRGNPVQAEVWRRVPVERQRAGTPPDAHDVGPLPGQCGVLLSIGGRPMLLELFATDTLLVAAWPQILEAAAREAAGRPDGGTTGHDARSFIGLVDRLHIHDTPGQGVGRTIAGAVGPLELRGVAYRDQLLHASIINHETGRV